MNSFYEDIIDTKKEVGKIFEVFSNDFSNEDWKNAQTEFHNEIEEKFPAIRCETDSDVVEEKNPIPDRLTKRVKVTTLLLGMLISGQKYNRDLYLNTLEFCTSFDVYDKEFIQNFG